MRVERRRHDFSWRIEDCPACRPQAASPSKALLSAERHLDPLSKAAALPQAPASQKSPARDAAPASAGQDSPPAVGASSTKVASRRSGTLPQSGSSTKVASRRSSTWILGLGGHPCKDLQLFKGHRPEKRRAGQGGIRAESASSTKTASQSLTPVSKASTAASALCRYISPERKFFFHGCHKFCSSRGGKKFRTYSLLG